MFRPWGTHGRRAAVAFGGFLLCLGVALAAAWHSSAEVPPGLGLRTRPVSGEGRGGALEVIEVLPHGSSEGTLRPKDRIFAVGERPLSQSNPEADFAARVEAAGPQSTLELQYQRAGRSETAALRVVGTNTSRGLQAMWWLCLRALAAVVLVGLLLWREGQRFGQLGLWRERPHEFVLLCGGTFVGSYLVHLLVSLPVALVGLLTGLAQKEAAQRKDVIEALSGTQMSVGAFALAMLVIATFEEVAFRAFLVPRLYRVVGRWWLAVLLGAALFGAGHVYEGPLAVVQTAALGAYFGLVFRWRFSLVPLVVAHAAFNTLNYALMLWVKSSGLLEKVPQLLLS